MECGTREWACIGGCMGALGCAWVREWVRWCVGGWVAWWTKMGAFGGWVSEWKGKMVWLRLDRWSR